jgi:hypothetical protein
VAMLTLTTFTQAQWLHYRTSGVVANDDIFEMSPENGKDCAHIGKQ